MKQNTIPTHPTPPQKKTSSKFREFPPPKNHTKTTAFIPVLGSPTNRVKMKPRDADLRILIQTSCTTNKGNPSKLSQHLFDTSKMGNSMTPEY